MENFIFSLNATIPIFLIIILGWALMQIGLFNKEFTTVADKYVFKVALPVLVFLDIATADIYKMFNLKFVLFCAIGTTLMFLGVWLFAHWYCKDKSMVGAFTQAAARGSAAIHNHGKFYIQFKCNDPDFSNYHSRLGTYADRPVQQRIHNRCRQICL